MTNKYPTKKEGFTLVELSIVIIIIGFLIAGIAAGQSLIHQAKINSVINEMQNFKLAYDGFIMRYYGVPGDINNATAYWPTNGICATQANNCSGNANGIINYGLEQFSAWKELQLAGLIAYSITAVPNGLASFSPGVNSPESKISNGDIGYMITGELGLSLFQSWNGGWGNGQNNWLYLGQLNVAHGTYVSAALKSEDSFNIDSKIDNGTIDANGNFNGAASGKYRSYNGADAASFCTTAWGGDIYNIAATIITCTVSFGLDQ